VAQSKHPVPAIIGALALSLLLTACDKKANDGGKPSEAGPKSEVVLPVQVAIVQPSNLARVINAVGTIRHRRETPLGFTTSGKVSAVRYDVGDYVRQGALIASLDTTNVSADVNVAEAESARADSEFSRIASLYRDGWITKSRYESAEATAKAARARVQQAGFARGTAQVYAPSSGVVLSRSAQPGQVVGAGSPVLILGQDNEGFVFRVPVVDADASKLRVGMAADIQIESLDSEPIKATISEIEGRANDATGAFTIQFRLSARKGIRSGQIGTALIAMPAANDGTMQIPASALFGVRTGEGLVYVVDPATNRVETRNVVIDRVTDGFVIVKGGVLAGDVIVVSGTEKLRTGSRVSPVRSAG
jgi:RND family efflux transporter MFP subunit